MAEYKYNDHPCIVPIAGEPHLRIFEDPFIEETLPKWAQSRVLNEQEMQKGLRDPMDATEDEDPSENFGAPEDFRNVTTDEDLAHLSEEARKANALARRRLLNNAKWDRDRYLRNRTETLKKMQKKNKFLEWLVSFLKAKPDSVEKTFSAVKAQIAVSTTAELEQARQLVNHYVKAVRDVGQVGKAQQLAACESFLTYQVALAKAGYNKYITEADVIKFMLKAERGVSVEYLRYYNGTMPAKVAAEKTKVDQLKIFDNYVVMFYDSDANRLKELKKEQVRQERERRRDPILFGTILGCRKLFYICDWVTPEDDLTFEVVEKLIGKAGLFPTKYETSVEADAEVQAAMDAMQHDLDSLMNASTPLQP